MCHPEYPDERQTPAPLPSLFLFSPQLWSLFKKPALSLPESLHSAAWKLLSHAIKKLSCISLWKVVQQRDACGNWRRQKRDAKLNFGGDWHPWAAAWESCLTQTTGPAASKGQGRLLSCQLSNPITSLWPGSFAFHYEVLGMKRDTVLIKGRPVWITWSVATDRPGANHTQESPEAHELQVEVLQSQAVGIVCLDKQADSVLFCK